MSDWEGGCCQLCWNDGREEHMPLVLSASESDHADRKADNFQEYIHLYRFNHTLHSSVCQLITANVIPKTSVSKSAANKCFTTACVLQSEPTNVRQLPGMCPHHNTTRPRHICQHAPLIRTIDPTRGIDAGPSRRAPTLSNAAHYIRSR